MIVRDISPENKIFSRWTCDRLGVYPANLRLYVYIYIYARIRPRYTYVAGDGRLGSNFPGKYDSTGDRFQRVPLSPGNVRSSSGEQRLGQWTRVDVCRPRERRRPARWAATRTVHGECPRLTRPLVTIRRARIIYARPVRIRRDWRTRTKLIYNYDVRLR